MSIILNNQNQKINIVVATSGDTGAAAIDAIKGKKNINIFVLHPHNSVSISSKKIDDYWKRSEMYLISQ